MDRGAWWATVHGIAKSQTQKVTNTHMHKKKIKANHCKIRKNRSVKGGNA